jgi:predicted DNA-binding transcriptional regulator AlpA
VIRRGLRTDTAAPGEAGSPDAAVSRRPDTGADPTKRRDEEGREVTGMGARMRQRRRQLDRTGIAERTGVSPATVDYWHVQRVKTGFPAKADTDIDGRDWWRQTEIDAFYARHLAERAAKLTAVDRSGHPRDLLTAPQAAKVLGYRNHRSLPDELLHNPDQAEELPSGRLRRYWYRRTVWNYADGRPLRHSTGRPAGTGTGPLQPHPYADDPRLDAALALIDKAEKADAGTTGLGAHLARQLGTAERTGQRLVAAAVELRSTHKATRPARRK